MIPEGERAIERGGCGLQTCDKVDADVVQLCQTYDKFKGNLPFALFVIRIGRLVHMQVIHKLLLSQVVIFAKVL